MIRNLRDPTLQDIALWNVMESHDINRLTKYCVNSRLLGVSGLWGVVNTAGWACKGRLEAQESTTWELMFRMNVVSTLRTARALLPLLRLTKGRRS